MGTSLTPDFWRLFAVLLAVSATLTFVVSALLDALYVRRLRRRRDRQPTARTDGAPDGRSPTPAHRTPDRPPAAPRTAHPIARP
ncbi:hypothetical protein E4N62_42505 [Streptomyces sp. MNU76]|uniref:hypothetical protein n=1 Tax=Streptomyces sp. MNU76 TaxID=2560026 RepID=UPI001E33E7FA|nr:hypothetical protein [Streptomyces sp. MNU76]MCC9711311.1 hypothetical protein [Streptomyces sp. MNU76]